MGASNGQTMPGDPFRFDDLPRTPLTRAAHAAARPFLERALALDTCRRIYQGLQPAPGKPFQDTVLEALGITAESRESLLSVPSSGPVIVAANHPHGALDGLALASVLASVRSDVRLVANHLLTRFDELRPLCFFVDPFEGAQAPHRSRAGLRAAHLWLRNGGALVIFPAGEVAAHRDPQGTPEDGIWRPTVGRLALATGATVVPAFIGGHNSRCFYAAGRLHPRLRTALLARELLASRGARVSIRFGPPLPAEALTRSGVDAAGATSLVRRAVFRLAHGETPCGQRSVDLPSASENSAQADGVQRPGTGTAIRRELAALADDARLLTAGDFEVACARAADIPSALTEIGRLRAETFAAVGEGTGQAIDLDRFDHHYLHLFCWDRRTERIAGAYRIGRTDRIVADQGIDGLYTRTLFRYDRRFVDRLAPALELGRSFVAAEYQRQSNALLCLWRGIGTFVTRHPEYRVLFGPVSISTRYSDSSHDLLMAFLEQNRLDQSLAELVEAIHPRRAGTPAGAAVPRTIGEADRLVEAAEPDAKGMPVLLRQYLKLNARLVGFNVDPDFGDALDALMMVDLTTVDPAILKRYLGRHEAAAYLAHHRPAPTGAAAA